MERPEMNATEGKKEAFSLRPTRKEADMQTDQKQEVRVHIRWMIRRDMPEVLAMEGESFEFPWLEDDFIRCLRQRNCIGMVAEHEDRVVGFMIYELHKTRIHVLNFAVADEYRRRGVGSQMVAKLIAKLSRSGGAASCWKSARRTWPPNCSSAKTASAPSPCCASYYADTPEDAYLMQYRYRAERQMAAEPADHGFYPPGRVTRLMPSVTA